jgi:hypothetical protein
MAKVELSIDQQEHERSSSARTLGIIAMAEQSAL